MRIVEPNSFNDGAGVVREEVEVLKYEQSQNVQSKPKYQSPSVVQSNLTTQIEIDGSTCDQNQSKYWSTPSIKHQATSQRDVVLKSDRNRIVCYQK